MSKYDVILDVYENQSISKAAQKHNYTQSAVSQTIRNYEKEIGLKLFKRSKNGMEALPGTEPIFEELMHIQYTDRSDCLKYQQSGQWFYPHRNGAEHCL